MKSVVFLFPNLAGHLNPTILLSREFQNRGFKVYYAGLIDLIPFTRANNFEFYPLNVLPFAIGFDSIVHHGKKEKWLESLLDRFSNKRFDQRKVQIEKLFQDINPDWIFLDEFNFTDFLFCYPYLQSRRIIQLQSKFPDYKNDHTPPLCLFKFPDKNIPYLWNKYMFKKKLKIFLDSIIFFGKSDLNLVNNAFKALNVDSKYKINIEKTFKPTFNQVEEWFLVPQELDFDGQDLQPWQHYIGPMVDLNKIETLEHNYLSFIQKRNINKSGKLIYCSLGTVLKTHLRNKIKLGQTFFQNLITIANENPNFYLIISLEKDLKRQFYGATANELDNVLIVDYAPQMDVLKQCDLFLTHAGLGSIVEAIFTSTPMLLFPLNELWDQNGNAARVVAKNMGRKGDLSFSVSQLSTEIDMLLNDSHYKSTTLELCELWKNKYKENYFSNFLTTELLVQ